MSAPDVPVAAVMPNRRAQKLSGDIDCHIDGDKDEELMLAALREEVGRWEFVENPDLLWNNILSLAVLQNIRNTPVP